MSKMPKSKACPCGSGKKYKKCCGLPIHFDLAQGEQGLVRPPIIPVEASFNEFVVEFGGSLVSELISIITNLPNNADYYFKDENVIIELKSFEKDHFSVPEDIVRMGKIIEKHRETGDVSGYAGVKWLLGQQDIPALYKRDRFSHVRRHIESTFRKANKQIKSTKVLLGKPDSRGLVLVANDGNYFSHPAEAIMLICEVMRRHFLDSDIDGVIYFTLNTHAKISGNSRELNYWVPVYRKDGDEVAKFVNKLGASWSEFYSRKIGENVPKFETDDIRVLKLMKLQRNLRRKV